MKVKVLKNLIYKGTILNAGEVHEIDDVSFYLLEKRGLVEAENKAEMKDEVPAELPPVALTHRK